MISRPPTFELKGMEAAIHGGLFPPMIRSDLHECACVLIRREASDLLLPPC